MIYNLEKTLDEEFAKRELKAELKVLKVARKLLQKGFAPAEVAEVTEIPLKEIEKLGQCLKMGAVFSCLLVTNCEGVKL